MIQVGVAAYSGSSGDMDAIAREFVDALSSDGIRLLVGGYWGSMRAVADRASERGIETVFILPDNPPAEPPRSGRFVSVRTGMEYKGRSVVLVKSSDVLVSIGGESGTLIEVALAYSMGVPSVVLEGTGLATDRLSSCFGGALDSRGTSRILYAKTPRELARLALEAAGGAVA